MIDQFKEKPSGLYQRQEKEEKRTFSEILGSLKRYKAGVRKENSDTYGKVYSLLENAQRILQQNTTFTPDELHGVIPKLQEDLEEMHKLLPSSENKLKELIQELQEQLKEKIDPYLFRKS